jgi:hypothetical protein
LRNRVFTKALERLELNAGKLACSVLRGGGGSNTVSLPDQEKRVKQRDDVVEAVRKGGCGASVGKSAAVSTFPQLVGWEIDQKSSSYSRLTTGNHP